MRYEAGGCGGGGGRSVRGWSGGSWPRLRRRKWSAAELTAMMLFVASILLLIIGLLLTVLGFGKRTGDELRMDEGGGGGGHQRHQLLLLLRIAGPSCLSMTTVIWVAGYIFVRLWRVEQRQHDTTMHELSDRLQLHAVARDLLKASSHHHRHSLSSSSMGLRSPSVIAYDAQLKRLLNRQLQRHHKSTGDHGSSEADSRRGSHCSMVVSSKCRPTSLLSSSCTFKTHHLSVDAGNAAEARPSSTAGGSHRSPRGVHGSSSLDSTMEDLEHFIIIHSKVSTCSSLSLAGSRSSRTSSSVGSFIYDIQTPAAEATDPTRTGSTSCRRRGSRDLNETKEDSAATTVPTTTQAKRGSASTLEVSYHPLFHGTTRRNSSSSCNGSKRKTPAGEGDRRPSWTAGTLSPPSTSMHAAQAAFRRPSSSSAVHRRQDNTHPSKTNTATPPS